MGPIDNARTMPMGRLEALQCLLLLYRLGGARPGQARPGQAGQVTTLLLVCEGQGDDALIVFQRPWHGKAVPQLRGQAEDYMHSKWSKGVKRELRMMHIMLRGWGCCALYLASAHPERLFG